MRAVQTALECEGRMLSVAGKGGEGLGRSNDFTVGLTWKRSWQAGVGITEFFSFNF